MQVKVLIQVNKEYIHLML